MQRARLAPKGHQLLVSQHTNQYHTTNDGKVQRTGDTQQIDEVLQHLQKNRTEHNAQDRTFTAAQ
jgi:hypothetical protein